MYTYLKGTITEVEPTYIALENQNIGYLIITPNSYRYKIGDFATIYVHHYVREDLDNLYGFISKDERDLFIKLISVSGIGPKSALSILASGESEKIVLAIETEDVKFLTKFPGIGPKSAMQIILDLKGKLTKEIVIVDDKGSEVKEALKSLGYSNREITKALKKIELDQPIEEVVKKALQLLIK